MFYLKEFWRNFLEKPMVYIYILMTLIISVIGMGYFMVLGNNPNSSINESGEVIFSYYFDISDHKKIKSDVFEKDPNIDKVFYLFYEVKGVDEKGKNKYLNIKLAYDCSSNEIWLKNSASISDGRNDIIINAEDVEFFKRNFPNDTIEEGKSVTIKGNKFNILAITDKFQTQAPYLSALEANDPKINFNLKKRLNNFEKLRYQIAYNGSFDIDEDIAYNIFGIVFSMICIINIGFLFVHLTKSNQRRYILYQTVGATRKQINIAIFVDEMIVALVGFFVGVVLSLAIVPMFTKGFVTKNDAVFEIILTGGNYLEIFLYNMASVLIVFFATMRQTNKNVLSMSGGDIND